MIEILKRPNVLQFIGGAVSVLIGALVLKQDANGALVLGGVIAMANAIKSVGHVMEEKAAQKRASVAPPEPVVEVDPDPADAPTVPGHKR